MVGLEVNFVVTVSRRRRREHRTKRRSVCAPSAVGGQCGVKHLYEFVRVLRSDEWKSATSTGMNAHCAELEYHSVTLTGWCQLLFVVPRQKPRDKSAEVASRTSTTHGSRWRLARAVTKNRTAAMFTDTDYDVDVAMFFKFAVL